MKTLPPRRPESHKGDFGSHLIVGGSRGMSGAIALAGSAALRTGAGLVTLAVPDVCVDVVAGFNPCYMTLPLPSDAEGRLSIDSISQVNDRLSNVDVLACGPGLGRSNQIAHLVGELYQHVELPMVVDADALNALVALRRRESSFQLQSHRGPRILTPHPGEFERLWSVFGSQTPDMREAARDLATRNELVVVLKGHRTLITDGESEYVNQTGNAGMATGGSGDVLTGIITALIGQSLTPLEAATYGCFVHGTAGDLAAEKRGQVSLIASDLVEYLPQALQAK